MAWAMMAKADRYKEPIRTCVVKEVTTEPSMMRSCSQDDRSLGEYGCPHAHGYVARDGREIYPAESVAVIVTGVPRAGRDDGVDIPTTDAS